MARNEDDFRIRPGKVRDRGGGQITGRRFGAARRRPTSFVGEVHRAIRRAGGNPNRDPGTGKAGGRFNARGRGAATALTLKDRRAWRGGGAYSGGAGGGEGPGGEPQPATRSRRRTAVRQRQVSGRAPALSRTGR